MFWLHVPTIKGSKRPRLQPRFLSPLSKLLELLLRIKMRKHLLVKSTKKQLKMRRESRRMSKLHKNCLKLSSKLQ